MQFSEFVWSTVAKRLHLDLTLKHIDKDLEAGMFGYKRKIDKDLEAGMFGSWRKIDKDLEAVMFGS